MADVITFPGAGAMPPAPAGPRIAPPDRDAMGERYVAYCEARDSGRTDEADLLAHAVAEDCGRWRDECDRLTEELARARGLR